MEHHKDHMTHHESISFWNSRLLLPVSIVVGAVIISGTILYIYKPDAYGTTAKTKKVVVQNPIPESYELPAVWGDLGARLVETGVIDKEKIETLYQSRGGLSEADKKLLYGTGNGKLVITKTNANLVLNMLWALGLGNKNEILTAGPITDKRYGGADRFASTGGWVLAKGEQMSHFNKHQFMTLTKEQQERVNNLAAKIYRPCCDNPTSFPDCNHGMAMLALLELMASQGVSEKDMYKAALAVNMLWFPGTYEQIADGLASQGKSIKSMAPEVLLDANYSSASGFQRFISLLEPTDRPQRGGGSCGV